MRSRDRLPHPLVAAVPLLVLIGLLAVVISLFGSDALGGASQLSLLVGTAVCIMLSTAVYGVPWRTFERQIEHNVGGIAVTLLILLAVGMVGGSWMVSGTVPTIIYYGIQLMSPRFFLVSACLICAVVSLLSGSSWTTIATLGVALIGIGRALGIDEAWTAGAIISGAYFGDKMSPLSDTTLLASTASGVSLFDHIRYMLCTTVPTFALTLAIFTVAGLVGGEGAPLEVGAYTQGLASTFRISLWTLLVPLLTGVLIARRVPPVVVLFVSAVAAGLTALVLQPHILHQVAGGEPASDVAALTRGLALAYYGSTHVATGLPQLDDLVATSGMAGMLDTIWLILCSMTFGAAMVASRMIESLTRVILRVARSCFSLVSATVGTSLLLNLATGDQYLSIVLAADMFRDAYRRQGFEARLLSRTTEDAATVTSVLIPWNTCGMTQATVLGVPTLTYLPYCFFNLLSPLTTLLVAALGWKIKKAK